MFETHEGTCIPYQPLINTQREATRLFSKRFTNVDQRPSEFMKCMVTIIRNMLMEQFALGSLELILYAHNVGNAIQLIFIKSRK